MSLPKSSVEIALRHIAADPQRTRDYLLRVSMIASLQRAKELGAAGG